MKIINESIAQTFTKGSEDKLSSLGVGRKILLIKTWLQKNNIDDYRINPDLSIDVFEDLYETIDELPNGELPEYINFNYINGEMVMTGSSLTSLRGFPKKVESYFSISNNNISSLKGGPEYVEGDYVINRNPISSLEYAPKYVGGSFYCDETNIGFYELEKYKQTAEIHGMKLVKESLEQGFTRGSDNKLSDLGVGKIPLIKKWLNDHYIRVYTINEDFSIDTPNDVELSDCLFGNLPDYIQFGTFKGDFDCNDVGLTTMKGFPKHVAGNFSCYDNNLTSCEFAPEFIGENCSFTNNPELSDITGFPKYIGSDLFIRDTKLSYALIRKSLAVKGDIFISIIKGIN